MCVRACVRVCVCLGHVCWPSSVQVSVRTFVRFPVRLSVVVVVVIAVIVVVLICATQQNNTKSANSPTTVDSVPANSPSNELRV